MTKHFRLSEFVKSTTAKRKNIDNTPPPDVVENIRTLCKEVLQPARDHFITKYTENRCRISITSGYRSPKLNKAVGSSKRSFHLYGYAADCEFLVLSGHRWVERNAELYDYIKDNLPFTELVWEYGNEENPDWVHVAYNPADGRKMIKKRT